MQKTDGAVDQSACGSQPVAPCVVPQLNDLIRMGSYTNRLIYTASIYRHLTLKYLFISDCKRGW